MIMQGRVRDISTDSINSSMVVIADMWDWDENERNILPTAVALLINLVRDQAYDVEQRIAEPTESALAIAPTWGYPTVVPDQVYESPDTENLPHF
jgi:hypothetical protein